jgi:hypothetical protein
VLTPRQEMMMAQDPYLIRDMARRLRRTHSGVEIRCNSFATLNGRPAQRLIDPNVNLDGALNTEWIVRLNPDLEDRRHHQDDHSR